MLKKILFSILALFLITASFAYYFRYDIHGYIKDSELKAHIGEIPTKNLQLFDPDGKLHTIDQLFAQPVVVLVYSDSCPPCKDAVKDISNHLVTINPKEINRKFVVLMFDDEESDYLTSFSNLEHYRVETARRNTVFSGWITPTFYLFDSKGKLESKVIGWRPIGFEDMFI